MKFGDRVISESALVVVIAEIGVNHDGSVARALELVEVAHSCGADAIKLQVFRADSLMHASGGFAGYQVGRVGERSPVEMLRRYELGEEECRRVLGRAKELGMVGVATPFSVGDVGVLERLGVDVVKVASPDLVNYPVLDRCALAGRPMLVSTGASNVEEIEGAVGRLRNRGAEFALMHCVSAYPTTVEDAQFTWIGELARFGGPVGYSDHTTEMAAGGLAVMAGACVVEKHLTYDKTAMGPDHSASADPAEFAEYVRAVRLAEKMRGGGPRRVLAVEEDVRRVSRQSLVAARDLAAGEVIRREDLTTMRPGTGVPAGRVDDVVGRRVMTAVAAGEMLAWEMLSDAAAA